jgi:hypothetical protein
LKSGQSRTFSFDARQPDARFIIGRVLIDQNLYTFSFFQPSFFVPHILRPWAGLEKKENGMILKAFSQDL